MNALARLDPDGPALLRAARFAALKAHSLELLQRFDPNEPRDEDGEWTDGGGDGGSGSGAGTDKPADKPAPNPQVTAVGGDKWNKETAARLEHEYVEAHAALDKIAHDAVGESVNESPDADEDEEPPFAPDSWDTMSGDQQSEAEDAYKEQTYESFLDSEIESWKSENAEDDARAQLAWDFTKGDDEDWAKKALADYRAQRADEGKPPIPYSDKALLNALTVAHDTGNYPISKGTTIDIDSAKLEPDLAANQPSLPGVEGGTPTELTPEMRGGIIEAVSEAFGERADKIDVEPPSYLADSVAEYQSEVWDQWDDDSKFNWVKNNTNIIETAEEDAAQGTVALDKLPAKFDPLQQNASAADYKRTQALARTMSIERAAQVLVGRGLVKDVGKAKSSVAAIDRRLWTAWKQSSTSDSGKLLQVAVAEELGGKLFKHKDLDPDEIIAKADRDRDFKAIGGFNGIKAYVRAKWETTQYLLDQAGLHTLPLYRAINVDGVDNPTYSIAESSPGTWAVNDGNGNTRHFDSKEKADAYVAEEQKANPPEPVEPVKVDIGETFSKLPNISVKRNGAASTTTDVGVANRWDGKSGRVVLRTEVPRTAVVSVPAYGINVQGEHEVVVAGTAWVGWDAWKDHAPTFDVVPLHKNEGIAA